MRGEGVRDGGVRVGGMRIGVVTGEGEGVWVGG